MNKKIKLRPLYDDLYNDLEMLYASSCYKEWFSEVSNHFERFNLPLPKKPISKKGCLGNPDEWTKKNFDKYYESVTSEEWKQVKEELKKSYILKKYQ